MGILTRITSAAKSSSNKSNESTLSTGGHGIDKNRVLAPTDPTVINPMNAGTWETVRTAPINDKPRYFNKAEADALKVVARQKREEARQAKRAYKSLKSLEEADAQVHTAHRGYIKKVADHELTKKRADATTARHLHTLRPEYAQLGFGLDRAENKAQQRIEELKAKIKEKY
ncbi:hypothetical protein NIES4072_47190 [Nostoc commune NIES-4072]|uniref:Uncharacterized protein n=1 Tax=Nostoc commune NIES-4072 TaxID=2005467 RepID=A0A2R5FQK5_NOSCO|nr:hypothetical protein [Nostoc commune]BBD67969.1 hypothetical protein NIES4070_43640 [Nostoc commune HK-02]GBG21037.1 hypothetical protein NIES4072_47190 [Nostoc commune NIES-4072]